MTNKWTVNLRSSRVKSGKENYSIIIIENKGELSQGLRYNKDMVKLFKLKLESDTTLLNGKFEHLNFTHQERHPLELIQLKAENKAEKLLKEKKADKLDSNYRVLRERKTFEESRKEKKKNFSTLTLRMERRVKKEGKYSSIETLTMRMLKSKGIYAESKVLAKINGIGEQKNYCIIALRLGLLYHHEIIFKKTIKRRAIQSIFECLALSLEECLYKKYVNNNSDSFVELVKSKNMRDMNVFRKALESNLKNFESVNSLIQGLYEKKNDGSPSLKNEGFCEKVTRILIGTALQGSFFRLGTHGKEIDLLDEIEFPNYAVDQAIKMEQHLEESMQEDFLELPPLDNCREKPVDTEDIFDLIRPFYMNAFTGKEMSTVTEMQYYPFYNENIFLME